MVLSLLLQEGKTGFPDNFFHFTFSNQVFEHVRDIRVVAGEISRITAKGGCGFHDYPAHRYITEGHLLMPFLHWLPKNRLRKFLIAVYVLIGKEPFWDQFKNFSRSQKVEAYYQYSLEKTFYRKYTDMKKVFEDHGFDINFVIINHPRIQQHKYLGQFLRYKFLKRLLNYALLMFKTQELFIKKKWDCFKKSGKVYESSQLLSNMRFY